MASGNKSIVFIFKWRVINFFLVASKEKGSMQRHPDSSGLGSARFHSSPGENWARVLESGGASSRLVNNTTRAGSSRLESLGGSSPREVTAAAGRWLAAEQKWEEGIK